ncbi:hypothetical protein [Methylocaldum sp. GT1TLB]|uniref:hypothetical protein n=1 Tax=Methylocaldum sp. GT1TLB TaxID=3438965 RepID=UPI003DA09667
MKPGLEPPLITLVLALLPLFHDAAGRENRKSGKAFCREKQVEKEFEAKRKALYTIQNALQTLKNTQPNQYVADYQNYLKSLERLAHGKRGQKDKGGRPLCKFAREYFYQVLTSPPLPDREDNWGKLFQTSGGIRQPASV